jgi:hypothetical protein
VIVHLWMGPTVCPTGGHGTLVLYLDGIQLFLEDKQYSSREDCNVPTLGHHYITECYDDQSSQMEVIASTGLLRGILGSGLHRSSISSL